MLSKMSRALLFSSHPQVLPENSDTSSLVSVFELLDFVVDFFPMDGGLSLAMINNMVEGILVNMQAGLQDGVLDVEMLGHTRRIGALGWLRS